MFFRFFISLSLSFSLPPSLLYSRCFTFVLLLCYLDDAFYPHSNMKMTISKCLHIQAAVNVALYKYTNISFRKARIRLRTIN